MISKTLKFGLPIFSTGMLIVAIAYVTWGRATGEPEQPPTRPGTSPFENTLAGAGVVEPKGENVAVAAPQPELVEEVLVTEGERLLGLVSSLDLVRLLADERVRPVGVAGLFPASRTGDDVIVRDEAGSERARVHFLRQQSDKDGERPNLCLADFVAEADDWIGGFAVTAGRGVAERVAEHRAADDDYNAILVESLADRIAEAFAEYLHARVRRELWGYAPDEGLANDDLIAERYQGIRPAPGYPACPEHTEKDTLWRLLDAERHTGIRLTEHYAMDPPAAVSGFYLGHPDAVYFGLGEIGRDQVADYARRKGWTMEEAERWLAPNLAYEPEEAEVA